MPDYNGDNKETRQTKRVDQSATISAEDNIP